MLAWAVQVTAGTTSSSERTQPASASRVQSRGERQQLPGQSDGIDQDERLQFHPRRRLIEESATQSALAACPKP